MIRYSSESYLKDVRKHDIKFFLNNELDYYIVVKKIIEIDSSFILNEYGKDITILDNNYSILEYIPKNENYICRIFIDDKENIIEKIFLFTRKNFLYDGIPGYDDLKICQICVNEKWKIYNKDLFNEMYCSKQIGDKIYELILNKINSVKEIELPFNYKDYL